MELLHSSQVLGDLWWLQSEIIFERKGTLFGEWEPLLDRGWVV